MAAGDVVSGMYSAVGFTTFQPAAGVIVCVTQILCNQNTHHVRVSGGGTTAPTVANAQDYYTNSTSSTSGTYNASFWSGLNHKWFIDNSSYIRFYTSATTYDCGFSGIQTA